MQGSNEYENVVTGKDSNQKYFCLVFELCSTEYENVVTGTILQNFNSVSFKVFVRNVLLIPLHTTCK